MNPAKNNSQFTIHHSQFLLLLILLGLSIPAITSCQQEDPDRPEKPDQVEILPEVIFSVVDDEPLHFHLDTRGTVEPVREFSVVPRVSGFIGSHVIEDGRSVRQGDVLLAFVDDEWKIAMAEVQNSYLRAKQNYDMELRLRTGNQGRASRSSTSAQLLPNDSEADTAGMSRFDERLLMNETGYAEARTSLERVELEKSYTTIRAPFNGQIYSQSLYSDGGYITAGTDMAKLVDFSRIRIRFDVLESEMLQVETGMDVRIRAADGTELQGRVRYISPQVDRERKTGQVIVEADNPGGRVKPGMSVDGRIFIGSAEGRVRAPRAALLERDKRSLVFKLNGNQLEWIYVTPEAVTSDWIIINSPDISPGDTLAVDRHFAVSHLQKVRPTIR